MPKSPQSWVRFQHPPTQWNLRGGRWSSVEYSTSKKIQKIPPLKYRLWLSSVAQAAEDLQASGWRGPISGAVVGDPAAGSRDRAHSQLPHRPPVLPHQARRQPHHILKIKDKNKWIFITTKTVVNMEISRWSKGYNNSEFNQIWSYQAFHYLWIFTEC